MATCLYDVKLELDSGHFGRVLFVVAHTGQKVDLLPRLRGHWVHKTGSPVKGKKKHG